MQPGKTRYNTFQPGTDDISNKKKTAMYKYVTAAAFSFTLLFIQVTGQNFKQQFNDLVTKKDTAGQQQLLAKWEKANQHDPELYVAYFNYYVIKSKKDIVALGQSPKGSDVFKVMDQDTTKKEPVAYMYGDTYYVPGLLSKGFDWINKGIKMHPDRLDMRFGKVYMFGQLEDYKNFTAEIIKTIDYSHDNFNKWTWADSKPLDKPTEFMLSAIQEYQLQLYNTENDSLLDNMQRIAATVLKYYPDHVESLSNTAIVYLLRKQYDQALVPLLKAEQLDPKDYIVLSNIAQAYKLKGDKKNAIKYYELTLQYGDEEAKQYAKGQIAELKKN